MTPLDRMRLQHYANHLHRCGPPTIAEALADVADRIRGGSVIFAVLVEYQRISPAMLRAAGGDRFPHRPLHEVTS